jgi:hypothetical protein
MFPQTATAGELMEGDAGKGQQRITRPAGSVHHDYFKNLHHSNIHIDKFTPNMEDMKN